MRRDQLPTPALLLDLDAMDRNIATMAGHARATGVGLRPHAKSHKCVEIARRLARAGALGPACATIAEAEAMAAGGMTGILVTSPMATADMLARVGRLLGRGADLTLVVDDPANAAALAGLAAGQGVTLPVIVELDVGVGRTGCREVADAVALARLIAGHGALRFAGVQAYWGNLQQIMPLAERERRVDAQAERLASLLTALRDIGLPAEIVTGGGTGTVFLDPATRLFTELQPGSFLFLDSCYGTIPLRGNDNPFVPALFVAAGVVSARQPRRVIVNAGYKALATDSGTPTPVRGAPPGSTYRFMGDEHGAIDLGHGPAPALGDVIELLTPHCDPTVNLHARYQVVRGEQVVDVWPIAARGY
jgi:D-serine deaminase-like pyridoxal phosphate-dependent protein